VNGDSVVTEDVVSETEEVRTVRNASVVRVKELKLLQIRRIVKLSSRDQLSHYQAPPRLSTDPQTHGRRINVTPIRLTAKSPTNTTTT
jgi:hypothetical protein